jgi:hypothetical protein
MRVVHETDRCHDQRQLECSSLEGQRFSHAAHDPDAAAAGVAEHAQRRIETEPDPERCGEPPGSDLPSNDPPQRRKLGFVGGIMAIEPALAALGVRVERKPFAPCRDLASPW